MKIFLRDSYEICENTLVVEEKERKLRPAKKFLTRRTSIQVNQHNKLIKKTKGYYDSRYDDQLLASNEHRNNIEEKSNGIHNSSPYISIRDIVKKHNTHLSPNASRYLTKSTIHRHVPKGVWPMNLLKEEDLHLKFLWYLKRMWPYITG